MTRRIERQLKAECADAEGFSRDPELQIASLSVMAARRDTARSGQCSDLVLLARQFGKPVASLETPGTQVQALQMPSPAETIAFVSSALDDLESGRTRPMLNRMAKVWTEGNYAELSRFESWCNCVDTAAERAAMKRMLDDRNPQLAAAIDTLHSGGTVFAAVCSLHLIGSKGLPALLRQRGYPGRAGRFRALIRPMQNRVHPRGLALWRWRWHRSDLGDGCFSLLELRRSGRSRRPFATPCRDQPGGDDALSLQTQIAAPSACARASPRRMRCSTR